MASYTEQQRIELINTICDEIAEGRSLRKVLLDEGMPSRPAFFQWIDGNDNRINQYTRACEARAEFIFDETFEIADDSRNDFIQKITAEGIVDQLNPENIQRTRARLDQRKWALSKMQPKKYGDKLDISSEDGSMTPIIGITFDREK